MAHNQKWNTFLTTVTNTSELVSRQRILYKTGSKLTWRLPWRCVENSLQLDGDHCRKEL